jgi:hypothetical protein
MSNMFLNYLVLVLVNYSRGVGGSKFYLVAPGHRNFIKCFAFFFKFLYQHVQISLIGSFNGVAIYFFDAVLPIVLRVQWCKVINITVCTA